jgi:hypothetical protein
VRRYFALVVTIVLGACSAPPNTTTLAPMPATAGEIELFCETYERVRNQNRQEVMAASMRLPRLR